MGIIGHSIEPVMKPLGFDWRLSVSILSGLAAKEVVVSTLGVIFQAETNSGKDSLVEKIQTQKDSKAKQCFHTTYCILIHAVYSDLLSMCWRGCRNQKRIGKLEMGGIHSLLYYRNSLVVIFYSISGRKNIDWLEGVSKVLCGALCLLCALCVTNNKELTQLVPLRRERSQRIHREPQRKHYCNFRLLRQYPYGKR